MSLQSIMSRKCVPFTPVTGKLSELSIALVSSSGVLLEGQEPYGESDESYRVIPGDVDVSTQRFKHPHYDTSEAARDPNVLFPMERLRELAAEGFIKKVSN